MNSIFYLKLIGWVVLVVNFFTIYKIYKSNILKKWLRILFPLFVNFPTVSSRAIDDLSFQIFNFQLFGFGSFYNQNGNFVAVAFPLGSIWVFYKIENWIREKEMQDY